MLQHEVDTYGYFELVDDRHDHYAAQVPETGFVHVKLTPAPDLPRGLPLPDYDLAVLNAQCALLGESTRSGNQVEDVEVHQLPDSYVVIQVRVPEDNASRSSARAGAAVYCDPLCTILGYRVHVSG